MALPAASTALAYNMAPGLRYTSGLAGLGLGQWGVLGLGGQEAGGAWLNLRLFQSRGGLAARMAEDNDLQLDPLNPPK